MGGSAPFIFASPIRPLSDESQQFLVSGSAAILQIYSTTGTQDECILFGTRRRDECALAKLAEALG